MKTVTLTCDICKRSRDENESGVSMIADPVIIIQGNNYTAVEYKDAIVKDRGKGQHVCRVCLSRLHEKVLIEARRLKDDISLFSNEDVRALFGRALPGTGFNWGAVQYWELNDGWLHPYVGGEIITEYSIKITMKMGGTVLPDPDDD